MRTARPELPFSLGAVIGSCTTYCRRPSRARPEWLLTSQRDPHSWISSRPIFGSDVVSVLVRGGRIRPGAPLLRPERGPGLRKEVEISFRDSGRQFRTKEALARNSVKEHKFRPRAATVEHQLYLSFRNPQICNQLNC